MWGRIKAILIQEVYITRHSLEVFMDIFFFPTMTTVVFGFISRYLSGQNILGAKYLLVGMLLWQVLQISQYSMSVGALWNIWSRNLSNMFIAPLSLTEYIIAQAISGSLKAILVFVFLSTISFFAFNFNLLNIGIINLFLYLVNLVVFAFSIGMVLLGIIFKYGTRIQALAWGLIFLFQPLTAALFPVSVLPPVIRDVSYIFPATYIFESARANITNPATNWNNILIASGLNFVYFVASVAFFNFLFNKSRETGQFARNEG